MTRSTPPSIRLRDLGLIGYEKAFEAQERAAAALREGGEETLFVLEHPPVITFGKNGGKEHLPFAPEEFTARGVELVQSSRGGSITCHFPGQLVAYPVMRVDTRPGGIRRFFHDMEESVIQTLATFGLCASRSEGRPGVWINGRKICSTGIAVKHWITRHGLSLNVAADLSLFDLVSPCGLPGVSATSLHKELCALRASEYSDQTTASGTPALPSPALLPDMQDVKRAFISAFCAAFSCCVSTHE